MNKYLDLNLYILTKDELGSPQIISPQCAKLMMVGLGLSPLSASPIHRRV